jgi:probable rRNA maturation factor
MAEQPEPKMNPSSDNSSTGEEITVEVDEAFAAEVDAADLAEAIAATLRAEERPGRGVTLVVTTDEAVAELNLHYRGFEEPTDVLSFPAQDPTPGFVSAPEMNAYLGDIVIAFPYTQRQAEELNRPLHDELRLLAVHGTLHLLGYDHATPAEEATMWAQQEAILAQLTQRPD